MGEVGLALSSSETEAILSVVLCLCHWGLKPVSFCCKLEMKESVFQDESGELLPLKIKAVLMLFTSCHLICNSLCRASHPHLRNINLNWSRARDD